MSMTSQAYEVRRWEGLEELQRLLTGKPGKPDYLNPTAYRQIDRISDLLKTFDLCDENLRGASIPSFATFQKVREELHRLEQELRANAETFHLLSRELVDIAESIKCDGE